MEDITYKTIRLKEDTWQKLSMEKARVKSKTFDEIINNLLQK